MGIVMLLNWDTFRGCWGAPSPASSASPAPMMGYTPNLQWSHPTCFLSPRTHRAKNLVEHRTAASVPSQGSKAGMRETKPLCSSQPKPKSLQPSSPWECWVSLGLRKLPWLRLWVELKINFQPPIPKVMTLQHFIPCKSSREIQLAPKTDIVSVQQLRKSSNTARAKNQRPSEEPCSIAPNALHVGRDQKRD